MSKIKGCGSPAMIGINTAASDLYGEGVSSTMQSVFPVSRGDKDETNIESLYC